MSGPTGEAAGRFVGRFALERELGSGGMATVYLGRDEVLDRPVAVKVLKHGFDDDIAERFQREGRTAARLSHPNIVQVYDAGEAELDGRTAPYIVMEHVAGGDLKRLIDTEGYLRAERLARLGAGISAGLAHAHERGVVHRDIKPHNVLLDEAGSPKLTDFGIARALDTTAMTVSGVYLGTALYSAPEQLRGEEVTPKSDVYALGAALHQAATGEPLFTGTPLEIASQHTGREPESPGVVRASGASEPDLDALILSCLAKDPENRPTASEVRDRLSSISGGSRDHGPDVAGDAARAREPRGTGHHTRRREGRRRRRPVLRTFAGAAALALLIAGGAFALLGDGGMQSPSPSGDVASNGDSGGDGQESSRPPDDAGSSGEPSAASSRDGAGETAPPASPAQPAGSRSGQTTQETAGDRVAGAEAAAQTIRDVYLLAAAGDYSGSYGLLSSGFRERVVGSQQNWAGTFETLESISFVEGPTASISGDTARVTGTTRAVHTDRTEINRGTWSLVREGGEWRLDSLSLQKL